MKLTKSQINEKVAQLLGYKPLTKREQQSAYEGSCYGTWKSPRGNATVLPKWTTSLDDATELIGEMSKSRDVVLRIADYDNEKIRCCELESDASFDFGDICISICAAYIYFQTDSMIEYSNP